MSERKTFTIHKSKKSLVDKLLTARQSLVKTLDSTDHRMETVAEINNVEFINDSKATEILDTRDSLKCLMKPIIWVACSTPHDRDYALIEKYVRYKVKSIIVLGSGGDDLKNSFEEKVDKFHKATNLYEAIAMAKKLALPGEVVLFSPSCASYDMFSNYVERGNAFKKVVTQLV
jgi:UDP-N-acetylmuramoylalanine--D-glutamate ligase